MIPSYLPNPKLLNSLSRAAEVVLGIGVLIPSLRLWYCYGVIALLVAVFPANIYMLTKAMDSENPEIPYMAMSFEASFPICVYLLGVESPQIV